jgi:gliding motility-associated-like protein
MKNLKSQIKISFFITISFVFLCSSVKAQIPAKCLEIESILVDACNATSLEPNNEMVRFRVGSNPINIADIRIDGQGATGPYVISAWPTTTLAWFGLIQNATTASATAALQSTVVASCGRLIEPPGGIIPSGANVLMIASTNVSIVDNSFSTLTDTLYIVYHNASYTVTTGHFKNYTPASSTRSIILKNTATGCSDTATYDVSLLTNISGGNGDRVDFSWSGVQTYLNEGCNAPFVPITSDGGSNTSACVGAPVSLTGIATGNYIGVIWQSEGSGTFSTPTSIATSYTPSAPGIYSISFGAITPCHDTVFSTLTLTITTPPSPIITLSGSSIICAGSSVTLTASGGATYLWNSGATAPAISVSSAGTYTVIATNSCGSVTATQLISFTPLPSVILNNSGTTNLCLGSTLTLWAIGVGGYVWSTGSTNDSVTVTTGGTYFVTASNSCGSVMSSITINNSSPPSPIITASGSTTICIGDSVTLLASGGTSYLWNTGATSSTINVSTGGIYTVTATNACGSSPATQTVIVNATPSVIINSSGTSFCSGDTLVLWALGSGSFVWSSGLTNDSISVTSSGNYYVTTTSSCGVASDTIAVTVLSIPNATITPLGSTLICSGSSVVLDGSGGATYLWSPSGDSSSSLSVSTPGTYTLSASNTCGTDTATILVNMLNIPTAFISPSGSTTFCLGDNLTLTASGASSLLWSTGVSGNSINVTEQGLYSVIANNICGADTAALLVNIDSVNAFFTGSTLSGTYPLVVDFTNSSSSSAISYVWSFGDGNSSTTFSPSNTFQTPGTYSVLLTVTNSNGCSDTYTIQIVVLEYPSMLIVPNTFTPNNDGNNDLFVVTSSNLKEYKCEIYDRWGLKMNTHSSALVGWDGKMDSGINANDGTYYYIIKAKGADDKIYNKTGYFLLIR